MKSIQVVTAEPSSPEFQHNKSIHFAQNINTVVNDIINSQYVVKDRKVFGSVLQTPVRESLHQLRKIADQLENNVNFKESYDYYQEERREDVFSDPKLIIHELFRFIELCEFNCKLDLTCQYEGASYVNLSESWLKRALAEILLNAIKHNTQKTKLSISVTLSVQQGNLYIAIEDNGKGIPYAVTHSIAFAAMSHGRKVFTQYRQLQPENLLAIQTQVMNRKGKLEVKSARKYKTSVRLSLPLSQLQPRAQQSMTTVCERTANYLPIETEHPETLLLVRHSDNVHDPKSEYVLNILSEVFQVTQSESLQEGFEQFKHKVPSCILMESKASEGNMLMLRSWLKLSPKYALVPMVVIAENVGQYQQLDALHSGINALISKPLDYREVIDIVKSLLQEKRRFLSLIEQGIATHHNDNANEQGSSQDNHIFKRKFSAMLEQHFHDEEFNRFKASELLFMHEKTLSRRLNTHYNGNFTEVLRRYRLNKAKEMIVNGIAVTSAAYSSGFNSPSYFTQCFKSAYGFAPSLLGK